MIVRDVDVLAEAARAPTSSVTFSVPTLDDEIWRRTEPGTAPPRQRLRALRTLVEAGMRASVGMAPILPGISDRPEQLADVVRAAREAGATASGRTCSTCARARASTSSRPRARLAEELERYERLYAGRAYLPAAEDAAGARRSSRSSPREHGIRDRRPAARAAAAAGARAARALAVLRERRAARTIPRREAMPPGRSPA